MFSTIYISRPISQLNRDSENNKKFERDIMYNHQKKKKEKSQDWLAHLLFRFFAVLWLFYTCIIDCETLKKFLTHTKYQLSVRSHNYNSLKRSSPIMTGVPSVRKWLASSLPLDASSDP